MSGEKVVHLKKFEFMKEASEKHKEASDLLMLFCVAPERIVAIFKYAEGPFKVRKAGVK